jgi:hypothetical protein
VARAAFRSTTAGIQAEPTRRRKTKRRTRVRQCFNSTSSPQQPVKDWWLYLTDLEHSKTKTFQAKESLCFQQFQQRTEHLQTALVQQARNFVPSQQTDIPELLGPFAYFTSYAEGQEVGSVCRIPGPPALVDQHELTVYVGIALLSLEGSAFEGLLAGIIPNNVKGNSSVQLGRVECGTMLLQVRMCV